MATTGNISACTRWLYNMTNLSISAEGEGRCIDVQNGEGPDIDVWHCKFPPHGDDPGAIQDVRKQKFHYDRVTKQIRTMEEIFSPLDKGQCLSLERIWPAPPGLDPFVVDSPGFYRTRFAH